MAKIVYGPLAGQVSGSIAGTTFSRNRYGSYIRNRAVPVVSTTTYAQNAKARLAQASENWRNLTAAQRHAWRTWAANNPVTDTLGMSQVLQPNAAYNAINTRLLLDGQSMLTDPPASPPPVAPAGIAVGITHGVGADPVVTITQSPDSGSDIEGWITAAVVLSSGINYVENLVKFIEQSTIVTATGVDISTALFARFGVAPVGAKVIAYAQTWDSTTGLLSGRVRAEGTVPAES